MILLDTNILISLHGGQLSSPMVAQLRSSPVSTCNVIIAELLSYPLLRMDDEAYFRALFETMNNHPLDTEVTKMTISVLRIAPSLSMSDAIIAATALVHRLVLWTHNTRDFKDVDGLQLFDPLAN